MIPWKTLGDDEKKFVELWLVLFGIGITSVVLVLRWVVSLA
jgi:hypothetical protein